MEPKNEFNIPLILWKSFENALAANGRIYVRELAKVLNVDEKALVKKVFSSPETTCIHIHNLQNTLQCDAYTMVNNIVAKCRKPVFTGSAFCCEHAIQRMNVMETADTVVVQKITDAPERDNLWIKNGKDVIDSGGNVVGTWDSARNKLTRFIIAKDE